MTRIMTKTMTTKIMTKIMTTKDDENYNSKWNEIVMKSIIKNMTKIWQTIWYGKQIILIQNMKFLMCLSRLSSKFQAFCQCLLSSILVKHLVVRCVSLPLPSSLFLSHFRLACPLSVPDYSIAWPLLRAHTLSDDQRCDTKRCENAWRKIRRKSVARNINIWWTMKKI